MLEHVSQVSEEVFRDLDRFGDRIVGEIDVLGRQAELELPYHEYVVLDKYNNHSSLLSVVYTMCLYTTLCIRYM